VARKPSQKKILDPKLPHSTFPIKTKGPRGLDLTGLHDKTSGPGDPPNWFTGSLPEWYVYWALMRIGRKPNIDFQYQAARLGGRQELGGAVLDFLVVPNIGINVQGVYFHYEQGAGKLAFDRQQAVHLAVKGITLIFIDEDALVNDATGSAAIDLVKSALQGIDKSRERGGGATF
jgi:hypothetical protein